MWLFGAFLASLQGPNSACGYCSQNRFNHIHISHISIYYLATLEVYIAMLLKMCKKQEVRI